MLSLLQTFTHHGSQRLAWAKGLGWNAAVGLVLAMARAQVAHAPLPLFGKMSAEKKNRHLDCTGENNQAWLLALSSCVTGKAPTMPVS